MGYNISGLVINKNYKDDFESLQKELGWFLKKEDTVSFELASSSWKDSEICDVYFSERGTLLFISESLSSEPLPIKRQNSLSFTLSESTMSFDLNYCERGALERSIMEVENDRITDDGEKLDVEEYSHDSSEIIWNQLEVVLGKSFWDIETDEKAVRYRFVKEDKFRKTKNNSNTKDTEDIIKADKDTFAKAIELKKEENSYAKASEFKKKWWKFW